MGGLEQEEEEKEQAEPADQELEGQEPEDQEPEDQEPEEQEPEEEEPEDQEPEDQETEDPATKGQTEEGSQTQKRTSTSMKRNKGDSETYEVETKYGTLASPGQSHDSDDTHKHQSAPPESSFTDP